MKRLTLLLTWMMVSLSMLAVGFNGTKPVAGKSYYLFNIYQAKFLSYDNALGMQVSLDNNKPLLCTLESVSGNFRLNTHISKTTGQYDAESDNYIAVVDNVPYVNSYRSDGNQTDRTPQTFKFTAVDEGYTLVLSSNVSKGLTFGTKNGEGVFVGSVCNVDNIKDASGLERGTWRFVTEEEYEAYKAKKKFTFAALNVDGMPKSIKVLTININLNPDAKEAAGATAIGKKLKTMGYDVVGVSEDFNYHSQIWDEAWNNGEDGDGVWSYNAATHRGNIAATAQAIARIASSTSPVFDIDGLGLFYKQNHVKFSEETWVSWKEHNGYTDEGADGLIDKGYRYYLITLEDGTEIDLYTLHMDAETNPADNAAREVQLTQLADAIKATQNKRPIIVMGDTNCRYTRDRLKSLFIDAINADPRFTVKDAWIEYAREGLYPACNGNSIMANGENGQGYRKGEVVDKFFYINNKESDIRIELETWCQDLSFINDALEPLADHWPCVGTLSYHKYDPAIDDQEDAKNEGEVYYLRNKKSGDFLKAGGMWDTHAVQGTYGTPITLRQLSNGQYALQTSMGYLKQDDPYMDGNEPVGWTLTEINGYYTLSYKSSTGSTMGLTGNDSRTFPALPNTRYVTCATYSRTNAWQQWELVTPEQLVEEMHSATESDPVNATFLLRGANFSNGDAENNAAWTGWPNGSTKMTYVNGGGNAETVYGNYVAEVYVSSYSGLTTYGTTWTIGQTIKDIPNGRYKVTMQGFSRVNYDPNATHDVKLQAASGGATASTVIKNMYSGANCTTSLGSTKEGSYYYPDNTSEAGAFFARGYYNNEVEVEVTDGTLTVSLVKDIVTKSSSVWTCFDNFQLFYLGDGISYMAHR